VISADITPSAAGERRDFRRLRIRDWPKSQEVISADITPSAAGKKRRFCRPRIRAPIG
jgi:hypothetical protein